MSASRPSRPLPPLVAGLLLLGILLPAPPPLGAQEPTSPTGALSGAVIDRDSGRAVPDVLLELLGPAGRLEVASDSLGAFRFPELDAGSYALRVRHLAYGELVSAVAVREGEEARIQVTIAPRAIELEAIEVEVLSRREEENRARGTRRNEISREMIMAPGNSHLNVAEILRKFVPGLQVRNRGAGTLCLEFRGNSSLQRDQQGCRSPLVYMDGMPIQAPATLYSQLPPETIQRMEFISPAEAGARYGMGSMFGVLLIESRRPGNNPDAEAERVARRLQEEGYRYDWQRETARHPWAKVLATSIAANAAGLALGTAAARQCITESPRTDGYVSNCGGMTTTSMAGAAVLLPALSASLAARYAGATGASRGSFAAAAVLSALALVPGYGLILSSEGDLGSAQGVTGQLLLAVGTPVIVTLADHLFRRAR